jgi:hypothetical protein
MGTDTATVRTRKEEAMSVKKQPKTEYLHLKLRPEVMDEIRKEAVAQSRSYQGQGEFIVSQWFKERGAKE